MISELITELREESQRHAHAYLAKELKGLGGMYVALDRDQRPCLFISATGHLRAPVLKTSLVSLHPNQEFVLSLPKRRSAAGRYHSLLCHADDPGDEDTFLLLLESFTSGVADAGAAESLILPFFQSLTRLFATVPAANHEAERQGLWGELFMMKAVIGYSFWAPYWHREVSSPFDFSTTAKRVEVKSSTTGIRIHHFSHRQVYAAPDEEIVIASLMLENDEHSLSLHTLIGECRARLQATPYIMKLERAVRHAKMKGPSEIGPVYDAEEARRLMRWYRAEDTPHFTMREPDGVSQTTYRADLTDAVPMREDDFRVWLQGWTEE